jgi:hypothetical protein
MPKFWIRYALSGGFGGCERADWEEVECKDLQAAEEAAYQGACEEYDQYEGLHGLRTVEEIMEEDEVSEKEAEEIYQEERESWLDYEVSETKPAEDAA